MLVSTDLPKPRSSNSLVAARESFSSSLSAAFLSLSKPKRLPQFRHLYSKSICCWLLAGLPPGFPLFPFSKAIVLSLGLSNSGGILPRRSRARLTSTVVGSSTPAIAADHRTIGIRKNIRPIRRDHLHAFMVECGITNKKSLRISRPFLMGIDRVSGRLNQDDAPSEYGAGSTPGARGAGIKRRPPISRRTLRGQRLLRSLAGL